MLKQYGLFASLHKYLMVKTVCHLCQQCNQRALWQNSSAIRAQNVQRHVKRNKVSILPIDFFFFFDGERTFKHFSVEWSGVVVSISSVCMHKSLCTPRCVQIRFTLNVLAYHIGLGFLNEAKLKTIELNDGERTRILTTICQS